MKPSPKPKVTLVGFTAPTFTSQLDLTGLIKTHELGPLQVIAVVWKQSKTTQPLTEILEEVSSMTPTELSDLMNAVLSGVPVVEAVSFNFIIENASISWR